MFKKLLLLNIAIIGIASKITPMNDEIRYEVVGSKTLRICKVLSPENELRELINIMPKKEPLIGIEDLPGGIPEQILEYIEYLKNEESNNHHQGTFELLLHGETGTGKSLIPEIIAKETGRDFYRISTCELITVIKDSGAKNIRKIFNDIRSRQQPSVLFIDDIDGIANIHFTESVELNAVAQLYNQIDRNDSLIVVVVATNTYDKLPAAFKDKFADNSILVSLPNKVKRVEILKFYAPAYLKTNAKFWEYLADETKGLTCRTLKHISTQANFIEFDENNINNNVELSEVCLSINEPHLADFSRNKDNEKNNKINENHYLLAIYTIREDKLPNYYTRKLLLKYYDGDGIDNLLDEDLIDFAAKETEHFSAHDICTAVNAIHSIYKKYKYRERKKEFMLDNALVLACIYCGQKNHLPNVEARKEIFQFFLRTYNSCLDDIVYDTLAYYTEGFTGKEIQALVSKAIERTEEQQANLPEQNLYIALHKVLIEKAIPISVLVYHSNTSNEESKIIEEITLSQESDYREAWSYGTLGRTNTLLDKKNLKNPNKRIRFFLISHFLSKAKNVSSSEIVFLAFITKKISWYTLEKLFNAANYRADRKNVAFLEAFEKEVLKFDANYGRKKQKFKNLRSNISEPPTTEDRSSITLLDKRKKFWKENKSRQNSCSCTLF